MTTKAMPFLAGICSNMRSRADSPPADAPIPTTGKPRLLGSGADCSAGCASVALLSVIAISVGAKTQSLPHGSGLVNHRIHSGMRHGWRAACGQPDVAPSCPSAAPARPGNLLTLAGRLGTLAPTTP